MKRLVLIMMSVAAILSGGHDAHAKKAVLVTHYGSSDPVTRAKTIDLITEDIVAAMPGYEVRDAYISPVVRRKLAVEGVTKDSPQEALVKLCADGYDSVYVQSTTLIDGAEMAEVRAACRKVAFLFKQLKVGESLCYSPEDCQTVVDIMAAESHDRDEAVVFVGHGNMLSSTATYSQLDYMLAASHHADFHVSTIEGYPTAETTLAQLKGSGGRIRKVKLVPLLLVCGNHTKRDISGEFAEKLNDGGYQTRVEMRGFGELDAVRQLYVSRVRHLVGDE